LEGSGKSKNSQIIGENVEHSVKKKAPFKGQDRPKTRGNGGKTRENAESQAKNGEKKNSKTTGDPI